jgi:hypothetical protein
MNKLFGLFLLALAFLAPNAAYAVNCFWVGGTGTWDNSAITHWAPTTGGAATGCQTSNAAPAAGDAITFDGSSGGGTVTPNGTIAGIAFGSLTAGQFTGTLAFNTNNPNMSFTGLVSFSGTGTRTIDMGSGTWTFTGNSTVFTCATSTGLTPTFQNAPLSFTGNNNFRTFAGGGRTYGSLTIGNNTPTGSFILTGGNTFASMTVGSGITIAASNFQDQTITGALTVTGTSTNQSGIIGSMDSTTKTTFTVGSASTLTWSGIGNIAKAGAGSITATNSFDLGNNSGVTITAPSAGGGGGRGIIGG